MKRRIAICLVTLFLGVVFASHQIGQAVIGQTEIYLPLVMRTATWQLVGTGSASGGGISNTPGNSSFPALAMAPNGTPYAVWEDNSGGNYEIYVRAWDGSSWSEVGTGSASGGGISNNAGVSEKPSIAIALDGTVYITWEDDSTGNDEIYIRAWSGSSWVEVGTGSASGGGVSNNAGASEHPAIAIDLDGTEYVAWEDNSNGYKKIYIRVWNGSSWAEVGTGSASGGGITDGGYGITTAIAIAPDGTPYVTWVDNNIYLLRWNGSDWVEVGGSASGGGISNNVGPVSAQSSIAISMDGQPYVAWQAHTGIGWEIYVRTWDGSSWTEVGAGSASGGGISNTPGWSFFPSIAVSPNGTPYIAWADESIAIGEWEIYVRQWNGSNWAEVGIGSASGGGISNSLNYADNPFLAINSTGIPYVIWVDSSQYPNNELYVLKYSD